jgi:hypothetical protein
MQSRLVLPFHAYGLPIATCYPGAFDCPCQYRKKSIAATVLSIHMKCASQCEQISTVPREKGI